ncbi:hypothetical protein EI42_03213 [Thermosporothrix hazakensis]|jgi:hypothetical protein|uniref:Uncharacterized protein n=2 Tax=Thermosporothrix TaxID=768650 RepID=A0A326UJ50_THEHA|nr:hypothetical protein [Thermosporothrix hazakensis]PZW28459.1 hypothetical protein EI42_03213 [Thermosporothrix hazakensis]BBH86348.1 hypothetical protein KTC_10990 [Thermosporothrix sp. COM3]GCE45237.1 hypothetical protein KTH_01060 [Thermosporothrix hazakensis]
MQALVYLLNHADLSEPLQQWIEQALEGEALHPLEAKQIVLAWQQVSGEYKEPEELGIKLAPIPTEHLVSLRSQEAQARAALAANPDNEIARSILRLIERIYTSYGLPRAQP